MEPLLDEVRAGDSVVLFELDGGRSSASLIAAFGRHLRASLREKDVVGRWDRGSFLAHIPVPGPIAQERVERIRTSWAAASAGPGFSAGVAMHDGASVERTVEAAAAALRQAREAGGGRTWANAG
jgi:GGDEF domain-containing protein